ncbi:MAG: hypothetical protein WDO16_23765 [Bacteroidota bacterium]
MNRYYWDAVYVRKASFPADIKIIAKTISISIKTFFRIFLGDTK